MIREGAKTAADVVEEDNDEDEEFVNATENCHEKALEEKDEGNREDIVVTSRPRRVDTLQSPRALEWISVFRETIQRLVRHLVS